MRILIVDDEKHIRDSLKKYLSLEGIASEAAESGEAALKFLEKEASARGIKHFHIFMKLAIVRCS